MKVVFSTDALEDYEYWGAHNEAAHRKILTLLQDIQRSPFSGIGKPEPLKDVLSGWWSRRITGEHRIVYRVSGKGADQKIEIAQCRHHY